MNRKRKMTAAATATEIGNVKHFPGLGVLDNETDDPAVKLPFWMQRAVDLHLMAMAAPTRPYWNPTMVGTWVAVIGLILFLTGLIAGGAFYMGVQHQKYDEMNLRLTKAEEDARRAAMLEASKSAQTGHEEPKQEQKKK